MKNVSEMTLVELDKELNHLAEDLASYFGDYPSRDETESKVFDITLELLKRLKEVKS